MEFEVKSSSAFEKPHIREGNYHAQFKCLRDIPDGEYGQRIAIVFDVYPSKLEGPVELAMIAYKVVSEKSKLGTVFSKLGANVSEGKKVDSNDLVGRYCQVLVEDYTNKDKDVASSITKVLNKSDDTEAFITFAKEAVKLQKRDADKKPKVEEESVK